MEVTPSGAPAIPPRRFVPNVVIPPVPSRWETCNEHPEHHHVAIYKTCLLFLCKECMVQLPLAHAQCEISILDTNLYSTCEELTVNLSQKLKLTRRTISTFYRTLSKKRDRMIKKRNETITEIERYFGTLKDKLISKLKHDETMLLNHLNEKVSEQDEVISNSIDDCSDILETLDEKKANVSSLSRLCASQRGSSSVTFLKNIVKTSSDIDTSAETKENLEAARDGFLLIRFYIDSEAEISALRSKVASVEVLSSVNQSSFNLEAEGINEASRNITVEAEHELNYMDDEPVEELRVALPPSDPRSMNGSPTESNASSSDSPPIQVCDLESLADGSLQTPPDSEQGPDAPDNEEAGAGVESEPQPQVDTETKQALVDVPDSQPSSLQSSPASPSPMTVTSVVESEPIADDNSITTVATRQENTQSPSTPTQTIEPEEPPPPYPGFPRIEPRPNELPPPYPGLPPPPPPYSQNPEPSSNRRSRLLETNESRALSAISPSTQNETPSTRGLKITKVFSVNEVHDKRSAGIFALAVVRSNCFVVVDRWNKKLKYFNPSGDSFGGLIFREEPWDVTLVTADLVAVTVPKLNTLYKIKVTEQSVITTSTVTTLRKYACVSFHKESEKFICGQVPQFGEPVIDVIDVDGGPILQTFRQDSDSRNSCVFSYPRYVKVTAEGIVIVCDWNLKCLLLFKLDGAFVGRYKGTVDFPLNEPTGMAYDAEKQEIYVIDSKFSSLSAAIHTVSLACECKDIIMWDNELRMSPAISPCRPGFAVGSKSGLVGLFTTRRSRSALH